jgi:coenzyme PQQ precursor peptide PqqA
MQWFTPAFVEIEMNAEINSYYSDDDFSFDV